MDRRSILILTLAGMLMVMVGIFSVRYIRLATPVQVGERAPDITATSAAGQPFRLSSLRGRPVLLNFFATWCQPCIEETPSIVHFAKANVGKVSVVMLDRGEDPTLVRQFIQAHHLPSSIIVLLNPTDAWSGKYGVTGQPETFVIDADGRVRVHLLGPQNTGHLSKIVDPYL